MESQLRKLLVITLLMAGLFVLGACNSGGQESNADSNAGSSAEDVFTININSVASATSVVNTETLEPWKKLVEEKTNGRVEVNLYHSAALGSPLSVLQDVEGGLYEVGFLLPHYFQDSSIFPFTITNLPFALSHVSMEDSNEIMKAFSDKHAEIIWEKVKPLAVYTADNSVAISKVPIRSMEDFKNLKTRTQGSNDSYLAEMWGGSPVSMPLTEIYSGLQTGLIDLTLDTSVGDATDLNLDEVADYAIDFTFKRVPIVFIMNDDFFQSMPEDLQQLFEEELFPAFQELGEKGMLKSQEDGYVRLHERFKEVIEITDEQYAEFSVAGEEVWKNWVNIANSRGFDAERLMNDFKAMIEERGYALPYE